MQEDQSSSTIVLSYDDLLVYADYFDNPVIFLHYLKQRKEAIHVPQLKGFSSGRLFRFTSDCMTSSSC